MLLQSMEQQAFTAHTHFWQFEPVRLNAAGLGLPQIVAAAADGGAAGDGKIRVLFVCLGTHPQILQLLCIEVDLTAC